MKNILIRLQLLASMFLLLLVSCSDEMEYVQGELPEGSEVFFAKDVKQSYTLEKGDAASFKLSVYRVNTEEKEVVTINQTEFSEGADAIFDIPESVEFRSGASETEFRVRYAKIEEGKSYSVKLTLGEGTPYANSSIVLKLTYPKKTEYNWQVVSENACLIENMLVFHSFQNLMIIDMTVEKAEGHNIYRFRSPYDNEYFAALLGPGYNSFFPEDYDYPYIILDGETYGEDGWYIPDTKLGFKLVAGGSPQRDDEFETFGSVAVNLSNNGQQIPSDSDDFPLGTYNRQSKMFDFGVVYEQVAGTGGGYQAFASGAFLLYLDKELMTQDYDRDYTWEERPDLTSLYQSTILKGAWSQEIESAEEDPTLYRFPSLYTNGVNIVFYCDTEKGSVSIPKGQFTGITTNFGNNVYLEATPGVSKYDKEEEILTLGYTFYLTDAQGNKTAELIQSVETILWGHATEIDQLVPGSKIDDFIGKWNAYGTNLSTNSVDTATVVITQNNSNNNMVNIANASKMDPGLFSDIFLANYDQRTGFITIKPQDISPIDDGYGTVYYPTLTFMNSSDGSFSMDKTEMLIGGFTKSGKLKFVNAESNSGRYDGFAYVAQTSEGYLIIGDQSSARVCGLNWDKYEETSTVNYVVPSLEKIAFTNMPLNFKKVVAERENPFLNIVPRPVSGGKFEIGRFQNTSGFIENVKLEKSN